MATRSFTVFQDTPSSSDAIPPARKVVRTSSRILTRSASTSNANIPASDMAVAIDKENYNPLTGQRDSLNTSPGEKKRKTTILATKAHVSTASKKAKNIEPDLKKRKTGISKSKASSSKDGKPSVSARKSKRTSPSRRVSPMPKLVEEKADDAAQGLSQAAINSRCYELTVSPLADVTEAYEATTPSNNENSKSEKSLYRIIRESSAEPELQDFFPAKSLSSLASSRLGHLAETDEAKHAHPFSTPERKKIYASFTFSSPSPSGDRFRDTYDPRPVSPTRLSAKKARLPSASGSVDHDEALTLLHP